MSSHSTSMYKSFIADILRLDEDKEKVIYIQCNKKYVANLKSRIVAAFPEFQHVNANNLSTFNSAPESGMIIEGPLPKTGDATSNYELLTELFCSKNTTISVPYLDGGSYKWKHKFIGSGRRILIGFGKYKRTQKKYVDKVLAMKTKAELESVLNSMRIMKTRTPVVVSARFVKVDNMPWI